MNRKLHTDAESIVRRAIEAVKPDTAVARALNGWIPEGRVYLVAIGKAAWQMARAALKALSFPPAGGIVITKYGHVMHPLEGIQCLEAGHPVPDENTYRATQAVLDMTFGLQKTDTVLFLISGGGSALFEKPLIPEEQLQDLTKQLLASGADIREINTIRKRLSAVKGGRFAEWCEPAHIRSVILSDVLGDPLDMIASGPAAPDQTACEDALRIVKKYDLKLTGEALACLQTETPKKLDNVDSLITGSVRELCLAAGEICRDMGYEPVFLTDHLDCEAREAGRFMASILRSHAGSLAAKAFIAGGETVVHLHGHGMGGRNQELALSAAELLNGIPNAALISAGSDGTDGPTDAAGGYCDGDTLEALKESGISLSAVLADNDAYTALKKIGGLFMTGPTGTNVNDVTIGLIGKS